MFVSTLAGESKVLQATFAEPEPHLDVMFLGRLRLLKKNFKPDVAVTVCTAKPVDNWALLYIANVDFSVFIATFEANDA